MKKTKKKFYIFSTHDFSKLHYIPINRVIYESNKKLIRKSMKKIGFDPSIPMILWIDMRGLYGKIGQWYILDGQHRFEVSVELDQDVYFTFHVFENENILSDDELKFQIREYITEIVNNNSKKWGAKDNIDSFVKEENPFYTKMDQLVKNTKLTNTHIIKFLTGNPEVTTNSIRKYGNKLKQGDPKFTNECIDLNVEIWKYFHYAGKFEFATPLARLVEKYMEDPQWDKYKRNLINSAKRGRMSHQPNVNSWYSKLKEWSKIPIKKLYV